MDWIDDYYTNKYAVLRDSKLGRLYYILFFLVICYLINSLFINQGYFEFDPNVIGAMRMRLREPVKPAENLVEFPYCAGSDGVSCKALDSYQIIYPPVENAALTISTYIEDVYEKKSCDGCPFQEISRQNYFVSQPEDFYVRLRHTFMATTFYEDSQGSVEFTESNGDMDGKLLSGWGSKTTVVSRYPKGIDELLLSDILSAAGISLADPSGVPSHVNESIRERGCFIYLTISYSNIGRIGTVHPTYTIRAIRLPETDYKVNEEINISTEERIIRKDTVCI